ncbi:hypothetical protein M8J76_003735 [Diaphorina citri]|nr:hypothetical protein M8J75_008979 [Diaphorina citri]KAI5723279.1 hypothetical protein M8J76_003735 [Diaphorina citri]
MSKQTRKHSRDKRSSKDRDGYICTTYRPCHVETNKRSDNGRNQRDDKKELPCVESEDISEESAVYCEDCLKKIQNPPNSSGSECSGTSDLDYLNSRNPSRKENSDFLYDVSENKSEDNYEESDSCNSLDPSTSAINILRRDTKRKQDSSSNDTLCDKIIYKPKVEQNQRRLSKKKEKMEDSCDEISDVSKPLKMLHHLICHGKYKPCEDKTQKHNKKDIKNKEGRRINQLKEEIRNNQPMKCYLTESIDNLQANRWKSHKQSGSRPARDSKSPHNREFKRENNPRRIRKDYSLTSPREWNRKKPKLISICCQTQSAEFGSPRRESSRKGTRSKSCQTSRHNYNGYNVTEPIFKQEPYTRSFRMETVTSCSESNYSPANHSQDEQEIKCDSIDSATNENQEVDLNESIYSEASQNTEPESSLKTIELHVDLAKTYREKDYNKPRASSEKYKRGSVGKRKTSYSNEEIKIYERAFRNEFKKISKNCDREKHKQKTDKCSKSKKKASRDIKSFKDKKSYKDKKVCKDIKRKTKRTKPYAREMDESEASLILNATDLSKLARMVQQLTADPSCYS